MPETNGSFLHKLKYIRAIIMDVDGVLTNNQILMLDNGEWLRQMSMRDGFALEYAVSKRYKICVISESGSEAIGKRLDALGVKEVYFNAEGKLAAMEKFLIEYEVDIHEVLYIGDDVNDLPCLKAAGIAACPADAVAEVKNISHYISSFKGGKGCVRDVIEMVMKAHQLWEF